MTVRPSGVATAVVAPLDRCWYGLLDLPPLRWCRRQFDYALAPLYRREACRRIRRIDADLAMIAPLGRPDLEARLRNTQAYWVERLTELG